MPKVVLRISCPSCDNTEVNTYVCRKCMKQIYIWHDGDISCGCSGYKKIWETAWKCDKHQELRTTTRERTIAAFSAGLVNLTLKALKTGETKDVDVHEGALESMMQY
mmetsp:Transcript_49341/g.60598  ORF Transcript_49341/g.60598 Transcript_49341/m.60598 type:complete len:107 (+) Transcript_49341:32-352(+)